MLEREHRGEQGLCCLQHYFDVRNGSHHSPAACRLAEIRMFDFDGDRLPRDVVRLATAPDLLGQRPQLGFGEIEIEIIDC